MVLMAYFSYIIAELCYYSGILTVFFYGIVMSHYNWHNITSKSKVTANPGKSIRVSLILFPYPVYLTLSNLPKKYDKIEFKLQFTIWWAGLISGAVFVTLAYSQVNPRTSFMDVRCISYYCAILDLGLRLFMNWKFSVAFPVVEDKDLNVCRIILDCGSMGLVLD
ncbi:hypothetical protein Ddye_016811 [Dipteronia dyeriana]|uniref:Uncharacterized protein n=1 Tax=Dipteronia dyeriana TaxID=168575 RepID=A0AAD9X0N8_9ROSI|nr:hypothetical protein Ddye_016811 [Dipteronia dyeriana]